MLSKEHSCYRPRRTGERKHKSVHECTVDTDRVFSNWLFINKKEGREEGRERGKERKRKRERRKGKEERRKGYSWTNRFYYGSVIPKELSEPERFSVPLKKVMFTSLQRAHKQSL